jgi:hypothetical protein
MEQYVQEFDCEFFDAKHFYESDKKADLSEWGAEMPLDVLFGKIKQFTELVDCKVEKPLSSKGLLYDEKMNFIKTAEVTFKKPEKTKQTAGDDLFKLAESCVNDIAVAA